MRLDGVREFLEDRTDVVPPVEALKLAADLFGEDEVIEALYRAIERRDAALAGKDRAFFREIMASPDGEIPSKKRNTNRSKSVSAT